MKHYYIAKNEASAKSLAEALSNPYSPIDRMVKPPSPESRYWGVVYDGGEVDLDVYGALAKRHSCIFAGYIAAGSGDVPGQVWFRSESRADVETVAAGLCRRGYFVVVWEPQTGATWGLDARPLPPKGRREHIERLLAEKADGHMAFYGRGIADNPVVVLRDSYFEDLSFGIYGHLGTFAKGLTSARHTRSPEESRAAHEEYFDKLWYGRHASSRKGTISYEPMKKIEKKYGVKNLGPWNDFEWGMISGKIAALRWMDGAEWDMLDS